MFLNLDAGERDDEPDALWAMADVLNCACGGHAGDARSMDRVAAFCARATLRLGAHPSYPDRPGFGRRSPFGALPAASVPPALAPGAPAVRSLRAAIIEQCAALRDVAKRHGVVVQSIKPHGALYHDAATWPEVAEVVLQAAGETLGPQVMVIGPATGALKERAASEGFHYAREGFADRRMRRGGGLVPRGQPDALLLDPQQAARQAAALAADVDTICVHADTPGALLILRAVREILDA
jgi:UPF0271 protein